MILTLVGIPTVVTTFWGINLWSGSKFDLAGPFNDGVNFTAPDYPTERYDSDPTLGVSWMFLYNSVGLVLLTLILFCVVFMYIRYKGLLRIRA
mmetsp:Transcript_46417/g.72672  ORF Transcript_46417/g.72672 Transcript_46417/m.72672 type:complete len:93 (-) Transcript_46417:247-525(-)